MMELYLNKTKELYPHIFMKIMKCGGDKRLQIDYIRNITIYELTKDREVVRQGLQYDCFAELNNYLVYLISCEDEGKVDINWTF